MTDFSPINQNIQREIDSINLFCIKNFYCISDNDRIKINLEIEKNYNYYYDINRSYNFPILEYTSEFFNNLYDKFLKVSYNIFGNFSLSTRNSTKCWCYRSNKNTFNSVWHSHKKTSTINGVYYYQIDLGDSISFLDKNNNVIEYFPNQGDMLIFPNNVLHKPNAPVNSLPNMYRYSINVEIIANESSDELFNRI